MVRPVRLTKAVSHDHFGELFAVAQDEMSPVEVVAKAGELSTGLDRNVHGFEFDDEGTIAAFHQYPWDVHAEEASWAHRHVSGASPHRWPQRTPATVSETSF